jgi:PKD repeat protein
VSAGPDKSHCEGLVDTLFATTNGIASYQWSNGATTWFIIPQVGGNYWVKVTNALGCTATDTAVLTVLPVTPATFTVAGANNPYAFTPTDTTGANYLWDFGDGSLSTKKTPTYTYQAYGNFNVSLKVTSTNGCVDSKTSALIYNSISSVEAAHLQLSAYPNPFAEELTVSYTLLKPSNVSMMVYDITGKQVYTAIDRKQMQGNITQTVDLAGVSNGLYLVKLTIDGQAYTLKVTKNKN